MRSSFRTATYPIIPPGFTVTCRSLTIQGGSSNPSVTVEGPSGSTAAGIMALGTSNTAATTTVLNVNSGGKLIINGTVSLNAGILNNGTVVSGSAGLLSIENTAGTTLIRGAGTMALNNITFIGGTRFDLTLTSPVTVAGRAWLTGGDVDANTPLSAAAGGRLRFVSSAVAGTPGKSPSGYVFRNSNAGQLLGTITVERAIAPGYNPGEGYRHYSTPVAGPAFTSLATTGTGAFTPQLGTNYNYPTTTPDVPPNVTEYREPLVPAVPATNTSVTPQVPYEAFAYGWRSPADANLQTGRGYTLRIDPAAKVALTGAANSGTYSTFLLTRGGNATQSGWNFVGNPYPTPLNISKVIADNLYNNTRKIEDIDVPGDSIPNPDYNPGGCEGTAYFFRSNGRYSGGYQFYNASTGTASDGVTQLFPVMQGFFVRKVTTTNPKAYVFKDSQRADPLNFGTTQLTPFYRNAGTAPVAATAPFWLEATDVLAKTTDRTAVAFRAGATPGHDYRYDAMRPGDNVKMPTLFTTDAGQDACMLNCLPLLTGTRTVPVGLRTLVPGRAYTLAAPAKQQLPAGTRVWLEDRAAGRSQEMTAGQAIAFTADADTYEAPAQK